MAQPSEMTSDQGSAQTSGGTDQVTGVRGEVENALLDDDYTTSIVPLSKRRSQLRMGILWASLNAAISVMVAGYIARSQGLSLSQLWVAMCLAVAVTMVYGFGAANLGTRTGQTLTLLTRTIFGRVGSGFVSILLVIIGMGWYCFTTYFLVTILNVFFPSVFASDHLGLWAAALAIVMITNNLIGFTGVMGYAVYVCTPAIIFWGIYVLIRGFTLVPSGVLFSPSSSHPTITVVAISIAILGGLTWGNEPDLFRWSKPDRSYNLPSLLFGYIFAAFLFTTGGYLMAELSSATAFGATIHNIVTYGVFGSVAAAVLIFVINSVASNDGNLYEAVNALQNVLSLKRGWKRYRSVILLGVAAAAIVTQFSSLSSTFLTITGISGVFVPCATFIMVIDVFVVPRVFGLQRPVHKITSWANTGTANWIGIVALASGLVLGATPVV